MPRGLAGWIIWPKPEPLAALENTVEAIERVGSDGSVVTALDEDAVRAQLRRLRGNDIEALAVCLINLFANPDHEQAIGRVGRYVAKLAEQLGRNGVDAALSILRSDGGVVGRVS